MSSHADDQPAPSRGRGKKRGGYGKAVRARGRGGRGRAAEFSTRLLLDGEKPLTEEEQAEHDRETREKYAKRALGSNADRYEEEEEDPEAEPEPEIDLSSFLTKQRTNLVSTTDSTSTNTTAATTSATLLATATTEADDVDASLSAVFSRTDGGTSSSGSKPKSRKGNQQEIAWDASLEEMAQEKSKADAVRDLKARFERDSKSKDGKRLFAVPVPDEPQTMEEFLDDLLG